MGADASGVASARSIAGAFAGAASPIVGAVGAFAVTVMSVGASGSAAFGVVSCVTSPPARLDGKASRGAVIPPSSASEGAPIWGRVVSRETTGFGAVAVLPASLMLPSSGGWCSVPAPISQISYRKFLTQPLLN